MVGFQNATNITWNNITDIINITSGDPTEFILNINTIAFGGWFFFIMLWVLAFILFRKAQEKNDQPLINAMYVMAAITVISLLMRAVFMVKLGVYYGLITDFQMWIFPLLTAMLAAANYFISD